MTRGKLTAISLAALVGVAFCAAHMLIAVIYWVGNRFFSTDV